jgi:hypothetical protein
MWFKGGGNFIGLFCMCGIGIAVPVFSIART